VSLGFAAPAFLALLATLPLVVWWHVTRLRHRPRRVAALFLWEQALRDAARKRRWRPTWSLLLQLLAVAAAALALAQPSVNWQGPPDLVIALDAGARMRAVDPEGERAARARDAALALAERAGAVALVRVGAVPELALAFTRDRVALLAALDAFEAGDAEVDVARGLDLARSVANGREIAWVSDDPGPPAPGITRLGVAGSGRNVGIVAFDLGIQQAFVSVVSDHPRPVSVGVVLERLDGSLVASTELLVPAGGRASTTFPVDVVGEIVRARLDLGPLVDALGLDDVAYAGRRALRVVMDQDEPALRRALGAVPGVEVQVTGSARFVAADLRVLTGAGPDGLRPGDHLLLPAPAAEPEARRVADWDRAHPLMRFVDLRETVVGLGPMAAASDVAPAPTPALPWATDVATLEAAGWTVLARTGDLRPVLAWRDRDGVRTFAFGAHPSQTDLVLRAAFPTLVANLVEVFRGSGRAPLGVRADDGSRVTEPGIARVAGREVTVSLLDATQTRLPGPQPDDREAAAAAPLRVERPTPLAWWLVAIAALALLIEWWSWARGPGAPSRPATPAPGRR
jgi:hypothetical protein